MESPAPAAADSENSLSQNRKRAGRRKGVAFALVFLAAFGVRALCWHDAGAEAGQVQTAVTNNYKHLAGLLRQNGAASFFDPSSPTSDPDLLGHPPGYPSLLALLYGAFGGGDAAAQIFQILCDSLAAALVLLIAAELLPGGVSVVACALVREGRSRPRNAPRVSEKFPTFDAEGFAGKRRQSRLSQTSRRR